jgi:hypothetical protein
MMENKHIAQIASITINYTDGATEDVYDSCVLLSYDRDADLISVRATHELSNEAVVLLCEDSAANLRELVEIPSEEVSK